MLSQRTLPLLLVLLLGFITFGETKPNVVFIIVDDLNDMPISRKENRWCRHPISID